MSTTTLRQPFFDAVSVTLLPRGFKFAKSMWTWRRKVDQGNTLWVHLNFGLGVINPSFGATYTDLAGLLPKEAGAVFQAAEMLPPTSGNEYSLDTPPKRLAEDILAHALPRLEKLLDRSHAIERLQSSRPDDWPVFGNAFRMRLLPLLLAHSGRRDEALAWLSTFEDSWLTEDQLVPRYPAFAAHFREKCEHLVPG